MVWSVDVPSAKLRAITKLAGVDEDDPGALGSYPLEESQLRGILSVLNLRAPMNELEFFLEPFAIPGSSEQAIPPRCIGAAAKR